MAFQSLTRKTSDSGKGAPTLSPYLTSYFVGNYKKYEAKLKGRSCILKLAKPEYPELPAVEFVCNKMAHDCRLNVPTPFTLIDFGKGELAFVSRNFMEDQRSHATLNHIYHYLPTGEKNYNVEVLQGVIFQETKSLQDLYMFYRALLFDALVGNHDRHGRNFAFIETAKGKRLAPIYDNPSSLGLESGAILKARHSPRGKIWTSESEEPTMKDYAEELINLGEMEAVTEFYNSIHLSKLLHRITDSHSLSKEMKQSFCRLIKERYGELENAIGEIAVEG